MMRYILSICFTFMLAHSVVAQKLDSLLNSTNKDAIYARPFVLQGELGKSNISIGGYLEGNTNYFSTDGVSDGFSMELRRFNIFLYTSVADRIKFLSELEFEHGTEEIALETALLDFEIDPTFIFRAGIVLPPIGYFNQNHDGPKWEFIDRPLVSTTIIPATLSEVGFGFHGSLPVQTNTFTYEVYLVNGLQDGVVANEFGRTSLPAGKNESMFAKDNNGSPNLTGRIAFKRRGIGEVGFSYYGGPYNTFEIDGLAIDKKRGLDVIAVDYNFHYKKLNILGEWVKASVDVPSELGPNFGSKQWGFHTDLIYPILERSILKFEEAKLNAAFRIEYVDYNSGAFQETGRNIFDQIVAITPGITLRLSPNTALKTNFRYLWERDVLGNPISKTAGFQFGFASYF